MVKLVFFDFDGVVLDSARIKTEAFPLVFDDYPQFKDQITEYHLAHQGVSRYKKFEWIYETLLKEELTEEQSLALGEKFSEIVLKRVLSCDEIKGAISLLQHLEKNEIVSVVASGTPFKELHTIVEKRGFSSYFDQVWGSPKKKVAIATDILQFYGVQPNEALFLGDASTDYEAAKEVGIPFVAVYSEEMETYWNKENVAPIHDLMELVPKYFS